MRETKDGYFKVGKINEKEISNLTFLNNNIKGIMMGDKIV